MHCYYHRLYHLNSHKVLLYNNLQGQNWSHMVKGMDEWSLNQFLDIFECIYSPVRNSIFIINIRYTVFFIAFNFVSSSTELFKESISSLHITAPLKKEQRKKLSPSPPCNTTALRQGPREKAANRLDYKLSSPRLFLGGFLIRSIYLGMLPTLEWAIIEQIFSGGYFFGVFILACCQKT